MKFLHVRVLQFLIDGLSIEHFRHSHESQYLYDIPVLKTFADPQMWERNERQKLPKEIASQVLHCDHTQIFNNLSTGVLILIIGQECEQDLNEENQLKR